MKEIRGLFAQANRNRVDEHELCAAISHRLSNGLARQWLQLAWIAADLNDRFRVTNVAMRRELRAEIVEKVLKAERDR